MAEDLQQSPWNFGNLDELPRIILVVKDEIKLTVSEAAIFHQLYRCQGEICSIHRLSAAVQHYTDLQYLRASARALKNRQQRIRIVPPFSLASGQENRITETLRQHMRKLGRKLNLANTAFTLTDSTENSAITGYNLVLPQGYVLTLHFQRHCYELTPA